MLIACLTVAVAAGNDNRDACTFSPAAADNPITVGASTIGDEKAYFSNHGKCVDIFAPGLNIKVRFVQLSARPVMLIDRTEHLEHWQLEHQHHLGHLHGQPPHRRSRRLCVTPSGIVRSRSGADDWTADFLSLYPDKLDFSSAAEADAVETVRSAFAWSSVSGQLVFDRIRQAVGLGARTATAPTPKKSLSPKALKKFMISLASKGVLDVSSQSLNMSIARA